MLEINNLTKREVEVKKLELIFNKFCSTLHLGKANVSLVFIGDKKSQELNFKYRKVNKATDVLSFPNPDFNKAADMFLGEIFINLREVSRIEKYQELIGELNAYYNSKKFCYRKLILNPSRTDQNVETYLLLFIFIHGLLHLVNYNDETEKERAIMIETGFNFLEKVFFNKQNMV